MHLSYQERFPLKGEPQHIALAVYIACLRWGFYV
jgi:hypothetical protein